MIAGDSLAEAPVPREGKITWRFQLVLLMRSVEREADRRQPPTAECESARSTLAPLQSEPLLEILPVDKDRALLCHQVHAQITGWTKDQVARRLSELFRRGRCRRCGPLGQSRYYRNA